MAKPVKSIILAAGKGSRMNSSIPKVLHKVNGIPMLKMILNTLESISEISENIVVVGPEKDKIFATIGNDISYVIQENQLGTAHAAKMAKEKLQNFQGDILVVCGDSPLLTKETLQKLIKIHQSSNTVCTVLTALLDNPSGYGRIIKQGSYITSIIEETDASDEVKTITEINSGVYIVNAQMLFEALDHIKNENIQNEFYLTDIVSYFISKSLKVNSYTTHDFIEIQGVNTQIQLDFVSSIARQRNI